MGILGPAWMVPDLDGSWKDTAQREVILDIARLTENEPVLGPRLMAVARKPMTATKGSDIVEERKEDFHEK